jgi:hypothetical protein
MSGSVVQEGTYISRIGILTLIYTEYKAQYRFSEVEQAPQTFVPLPEIAPSLEGGVPDMTFAVRSPSVFLAKR